MSSVIFMFFFCLVSIGHSQTILDLNNLKLNASPIKELNIESITNVLGRPSATNNSPIAPEIVEIVGAEIYYHDKGLKFCFKPKSEDPKERLKVAEIYLVKTWDNKNDKYFMPFKDKINPVVNPNMKLEKLIVLLKKFNPITKSAEECRTENNNALKKLGLTGNSNVVHDQLIVKTANGEVKYHCEELTKFLEYISIFPD